MTAFKEKFGQIAQDQEKHEQGQQNIEIDNAKEQDVAVDRQGHVAGDQTLFQPGQKAKQNEADCNDDTDELSFLLPLSWLQGWPF